MLIGSMASPFCTPLSLKIHQGLIHVNDGDSSEESRAGKQDCSNGAKFCDEARKIGRVDGTSTAVHDQCGLLRLRPGKRA